MEIRDDGASVIVDGVAFSGFLADDRSCQFCDGVPTVYLDEFDAYACPSCNRWLEEKCRDPYCGRCPNRPEVPFGARESLAPLET